MRRYKRIMCITIAVLFLLAPLGALADLVPVTSEGVDLVFDTLTEEYWVADLTRYSNMTFEEQILQIIEDDLNMFAGVNDWVMASQEQVEALFESIQTVEDAELFTPNFIGEFGDIGWLGRTLPAPDGFSIRRGVYVLPNGTEVFEDIPIVVRPDYSDDDTSAWVKSVTGPKPVPEPSTILLIGTGLAGLMGFRRKFKS